MISLTDASLNVASTREIRMSGSGLGCVKTQGRCEGVEWAFRQASFLVVEASRARSVAIDFRKLF